MKKVETERFQAKRPEEISFTGTPLTDSPPKKEMSGQASVRPHVRPYVRTDEPKQDRPLKSPAEKESVNMYTIPIPEQRRKIRHPFDFYEDQLEALKIIQIARREGSGLKQPPSLGEMAREAMDDFIKITAKQSQNISVSHEQDKNK